MIPRPADSHDYGSWEYEGTKGNEDSAEKITAKIQQEFKVPTAKDKLDEEGRVRQK